MIKSIYLQAGIYNLILISILLVQTYKYYKHFLDCKLFFQVLVASAVAIVADCASWVFDGTQTGSLSLITALINILYQCATSVVLFGWSRYTLFLAHEDEKVVSTSKVTTVICILNAVLSFTSLWTKLYFYIDSDGLFVRGRGYFIYILLCVIQLSFSVVVCIISIFKSKNAQKKKELLQIVLFICVLIAALIVIGMLSSYPAFWTCLTFVILFFYIHIQEKRGATERENQNSILRDALAQAQYANNAKTTFLSNMSHDIRTPMNAIIGFTAIAARHIDEQKIVESSLRKIMTSSNHLLNLINDVLDMSRIESGKMQLQIAACNLATIMHDLVDMVQSQVLAKQLDLFVDTLNVENEEVYADSMKLNQILLNLVGNAIKFNKTGGVVSIRIEQKQSSREGCGHFIFTVKDTGCGISPSFISHIFEPFEREQDTTKSKIEGTGLGMAIVKNIVDMMSGTVSVNSEVGKGSEFKVEVDLKLQNVEETKLNLEKLHGLHALVADDDYNTCDSVTSMLKQLGMTADWTLTGKEAVLKATKAFKEEIGYSVFIIDWLMPDMNGVEVVRRIRMVIGKDTPIFILTAYDWSDVEAEAREAGVTAFCRKPLFMSELREVLIGAASGTTKLEQSNPNSVLPTNRDILKGRRILVAEDHPLNLEIAIRVLADAGMQVEEAENGSLAVEKFKLSRENYYDLILMDIRMPVMNGLEASKAIRSLKRKDSDIPIIAMTANAFDEDVQLCLAAGMDAHLSKPMDPIKLYSVLAKWLEKGKK